MPLQGGKKKKGLIYDLHLVNSMKIGKIDVNLFQVFKYDKLLFQHFSSILTRRNIENPHMISFETFLDTSMNAQ